MKLPVDNANSFGARRNKHSAKQRLTKNGPAEEVSRGRGENSNVAIVRPADDSGFVAVIRPAAVGIFSRGSGAFRPQL
jgi:hypothetical protein